MEGCSQALDRSNENRLRQIDLSARRAERSFNQASKALREIQTDRRFRNEAKPCPADPEQPSIHNGAALISYAKIMPAIGAEKGL